MIPSLAGFLASLCFGYIFHVRGRRLVFAGICGGLGCFVHQLPIPDSTVFPAFLAACTITLSAELMARMAKSPATVFLAAGLIPIVPGGGMYRCMYLALERQLDTAALTLYETLLEAGAIAIGVVTVTSLVRLTAGFTGKKKKTAGS